MLRRPRRPSDINGLQPLADINGLQPLADINGLQPLADINGLQPLAEHSVAGALGQVEGAESPIVTRPPTVTA